MTSLPIDYPLGSDSFIAPVTKNAMEKASLGGDCYILLSFNHDEFKTFLKGSYSVHRGRKWEIMEDVIPQSLANADGYKYEIKLYAQQHHLKRRRVFWTQGTTREATFSLTTTLSSFAQLIVDNMNTFLGVEYWSVGNIPEDIAEKTLHQSFDGISCWEALDGISKSFGVEWWSEDDAAPASVKIHFGKCANGEYIDFVEGDIVSKFPIAKKGESANYGTRFYIFGGTRNIPEDYYENMQGGTTNHVSEKRLHLPDGLTYIDAWENLADRDVVEQVVKLDNIYPKNTETITSVSTKVITEGENSTTYYVITCANTAFKPSNLMERNTLGAVFTSGSLQGREFELSLDGKDSDFTFDNSFVIIVQSENAGGEDVVNIPNEFLKPAVGDTFILTGVKLPEENIADAEAELLTRGQEIAKERSSDTNVYDCPTNPVYCQNNDIDLSLGQRVNLVGSSFREGSRKSRVQGYEKSLHNPYSATYTIGDNTTYSRYLALASKINIDIQQIKTKEESLQSSSERFTFTTQSTITKVASDVVEAKTLATSAQTTANKASEGLSANEKAVFAIDKRLQAVEANTGSADISALKEQVDTNTTNIATLSNRIAEVSGRLIVVEEEQTAQGNLIVTMNTKVTSLTTRVTNIEKKVMVAVINGEAAAEGNLIVEEASEGNIIVS